MQGEWNGVDAAAANETGYDSNAEPLPLSAEPTLTEIAQVARTSPNAAQRIEMLKLLEHKKTQAATLAIRHNLGSAHPGVRAAAEAAMITLFGPEWNRTRTIAPPVQPPRSDDNGRGPGGAF